MRFQRVTVLIALGLMLAAWLMAAPIGWIDQPAQAQAALQPVPTPTAASTEPVTLGPAATLTPMAQPLAASPAPTIKAAPQAASVPIDVILVGVVMVLAIIGIFIGFRAQRA